MTAFLGNVPSGMTVLTPDNHTWDFWALLYLST
jgi:hypothetical protein